MQQATQILTQLVERWAQAERHGDAASQAKLLHEQFVGIGPLGFTLTKEDWLQRITSGQLKYESLQVDDISVRQFGAAAIVIARQTQVALFGPQRIEAELRTSFTLVRPDDDWQIAGIQMSTIGQPPQFSRQQED